MSPSLASLRGAVTGLRCALMALLSGIGLPLCAQTTASAAKAGADGAAPLGADAIRDVLKQLDAAFDRGDADAWLAVFAPDHPGAHAMLKQRLLHTFAPGLPMKSTSSLVGEPVRVGPRTVVRIRHEVRATFPAPSGGAGQPAAPTATEERVLVDDSMMALRGGAAQGDRGETAVPTFLIEIPVDAEARTDRTFRCPPCNYEIGGVAGWLCVPTRRDRALSLEGASFYLIGTDLACDVSVQIDDSMTAPTAVVQRLGRALHQLDLGAQPGLAVSWLPAAHAGEPPRELTGARLDIDLPKDATSADGSRAMFHVTAFGALQHLLLVRGSKRALRDHDQELQALLASFRLLDTNCDRVRAALRPVEHHTGGTLTAGVYTNDRFDIELTGPKGWKAQQRCGGAEFRVVWTSPNGSRLWLTGYAVPQSMTRWCRTTADLWLADQCAAQGLQASPTADAGDWAPLDPCNGLGRRATWVARPGGAPGAVPERQLRFLLRDDLLVVVDGTVATEADAAALRAAMASLQRR